jgi:hypothetical protein
MGAWGAGSFDNDSALDFAGEIASIADLEAIFVPEGTVEIDADLACQLIVAGECVAAMRGHPNPDMPEELAETVGAFGKPSIKLFDDARNNVSAVLSGGELLELWADAGQDERGAFNRAMTDLIARLNQPQAKVKKAKAGKAKTPVKKKVNPNPSPCMICNKPMGDGEFHQIDITLMADDFGDMKQGGWVHMGCLNAALHPKHMIQNWQFDDDLLELARQKIRAED